MNQFILQLFVNFFKHLFERRQLVGLILSDLLLALDHERHVPEKSVMLEEVCEVGEVTGAPPGVLERGNAEEVPKPSHFNNIYIIIIIISFGSSLNSQWRSCPPEVSSLISNHPLCYC
jgi:hypothetical protein